nr:hypothetical protein [Streptomyces pathocidini]
MRAMAGLWRWRRNPLCRRTDVVESWVALLAALLITVGTPVAGLLAGALAQDALAGAAREQQEHRHLVTATVVRSVPQPPLDPDPETSSARDSHRRVVASWKTADEAVRTGPVKAPDAATPGDRFRIWTDDRGRVTTRPLSPSATLSHAALAGVGGAAAAAGLVEGARRFTVWRLMRRRFEEWDRAWERAREDWGRTGADS